ncbi:MAG: SNF2-related protein [Microscillaceae bacterium]|nr:SNF2-related protein [Microscillaceae bacterium]MDW8460105.1 SNF2-related protein [Cytophagales bacterium]
MKIAPDVDFQVVYSLYKHEYLGYLFNAYIIELDSKGQLTLKNQAITATTANDFKAGLSEQDFEIIKLIESMQQESIIKKFYGKRATPQEFFLKVYHKQKGNLVLQEAIEEHLEVCRSKLMPLLKDQQLFIMGKDGNPTWKPIEVIQQPATIYFHFKKQDDQSIVYYPTVYCNKEKLNIFGAIVICNQPAWIVIQQKLYQFDKNIDGRKIEPFTRKYNITIPPKNLESYYQKFVSSLVASFDVKQDCFKVITYQDTPQAILQISEYFVEENPQLFENTAGKTERQAKILLELFFAYNNFLLKTEDLTEKNKETTHVKVQVEKIENDFIFHKIYRQTTQEKNVIEFLKQTGIELKQGRALLSKNQAFEWINTQQKHFTQYNLLLKSNLQGKKYFLGKANIQVEIKESHDWFDILATIKFGDFEIPFIKLRQIILQQKTEFELPNGEIAIIPESWLQRYSELFYFSEENSQNIKLKKHHLGIVQKLRAHDYARVTMNRKLEKLYDFQEIEDVPLPKNFQGTLRPYQKAAYNWLHFLNKYHFGGCLADDMGLGKTATTLALLQSQVEAGVKESSLVIVPTSLIYNWEMEAKKFTPKLKILVYNGTNRLKTTNYFDYFDVVITSYSITRLDIDILEKYLFHYIILDESQAIKNPSSHITIAVNRLNSRHKLILTGTPLENTTLDLWSQMSFINPGLLGSQSFFKREFLQAIEKNADRQKLERLSNLIKPFILRRLKSQVATELPTKIESLQYCLMTPAQEQLYETTKAAYRNQILELIEREGIAKSQLLVLQGLTKLRQIACHPQMIDPKYKGGSGKIEDVMYKIEEVISEGHKVLVFSQFVKQLNILKQAIEQKKWKYVFLDGSTKNRQAEVAQFQQNKHIKIFLISLKAGGVGLNLTQAEYVFLLDPWWNPAVEAQAIDRTHRLGQKNTVFAYKFITKNTVEEKIVSLQKNKLQLAENIILTDESITKNLTPEDILNLLS